MTGEDLKRGLDVARLSVEARTVWAKYDRGVDGWLALWRHMADSGAVAGRLWDRWLPGNVRGLVAEALPGGMDDARLLAVWLATVHDIGKATPAFACQVESLAGMMTSVGLAMPTLKQFGDDRKLAPHGLAGQVLLTDWLVRKHGWSVPAALPFAVVIGGHHGVPPTEAQVADVTDHPRLLRTRGPAEAVWRAVQTELLDEVARACGVVERLVAWRDVRLPQPVQVLLSAVVIVADWIASSAELFPYDGTGGGGTTTERRLESAWREVDLPVWEADAPTASAQDLLVARFSLPSDARIRPVQEAAVRLVREMPTPGLLVIEAPMGEGKTEAALLTAEILAGRSGAGGVFVALPTRATANAMFARLTAWLERLPGGGQRSVFLQHAKAALSDDYADLLRRGGRAVTAIECDAAGHSGSPGDRRDPAVLVAHQWLRGRKKGMLASFGVGTVDQLLVAGLRSRHLALRHLALAGKVVILDEVHAYDAYMNTYLDRVLTWLGSYRVPVVLLSATLPTQRRQELISAYTGQAVSTNPSDEASYPVVTAAATGAEPLVALPSAATDRRVDVRVEPLDDDMVVLADRLAEELADGGCALVIRNTVQRVLDAAEVLRKRFGEDAVTVAHARFVDADRARLDRRLLELFGPDGKRPTGPHVVVATQVAEQSLDIDFDLLVTDLAPIDLVLQRMGRVHRHQRGAGQSERPARLRVARCLITGTAWDASPPEPVRGSVAVYQRYPLLRASAVLRPHLAGEPLSLPDRIGPLVQAAYGDREVGPAEWQPAVRAAEEEFALRRARQEATADEFRVAPPRGAKPLLGWVSAGIGDADESVRGRAQVRDGEEGLEVLVIQRRADGRLTTLPHLDRGRGGLELPEHLPPSPWLARAVAASALRLPYQFTRFPPVLDRTIGELEKNYIPAWQGRECPLLDGQLLLVLDEDCRTALAGFDLSYSAVDGLRVSSLSDDGK